ncbi:MAG: M24 family metallopeptidase [Chloroflexi bacterium]|nr:M24 family metallopeptidase [Chloroflexota bacterium]
MDGSVELSPSTLAIAASEVTRRLERTRHAAQAAGYDGLLVVGRPFFERPGDLAYLTNHFPPFPTAPFLPTQRGTGHAVLILPVSHEPLLIVDHPAIHRPLIPIDAIHPAPDVFGAVHAYLRNHPAWHTLGIVGSDLLPWAAWLLLQEALPSAHFTIADDLVRKQRRVKSPAERALLIEAIRIAEIGLSAALDIVAPGITEREVSAQGTAACLRAGADFVRYFRVHSGPYSAWGSRWPQATDRQIANGDAVVLDAIGAVHGYAFDINRTTVCGSPSALIRERYALNQQAIAAMRSHVRPGTSVAAAVQAARQVYAAAGVESFAARSSGHGIGLETVEEPLLLCDNPELLVENEVLCLEPGLFDPIGIGVTTEEVIHVTSQGAHQLTQLAVTL